VVEAFLVAKMERELAVIFNKSLGEDKRDHVQKVWPI
jgi:hypothetical protein